MKTFWFVVAAWIAGSGLAAAQQAVPAATIPRADAHFVIGWQNLRQARGGDDVFDSYNNWANAIFYAGAGGGWYWTEHAKTQIDYGAGTRGRHYRYRTVTINGQLTSESSRVAVQQQSVALSQQYQFFRNQWFHPRVGAGVDIARETSTVEYQPVFVYDSATRTSRQVTPTRVEGPSHRAIVRPFGEVGFKAYVTPRAFFTGDSRLMFRGGIDEVLFRIGFGVDF